MGSITSRSIRSPGLHSAEERVRDNRKRNGVPSSRTSSPSGVCFAGRLAVVTGVLDATFALVSSAINEDGTRIEKIKRRLRNCFTLVLPIESSSILAVGLAEVNENYRER